MVWITKPPLGTQLDWTNPLNQGLAGFWVFNEGMGDKVNDLSGNANTGTLTNMAFPSTTISGWNPGRLGPAIAFDGVNDYVDAGNGASLNITSAITIEAWVKSNTINEWFGIIVKTTDYATLTNGYGVSREKTSNNLYLWVGNGTSYSRAFVNSPIGEWNHIAMTYASGIGGNVWKNGINVGNLNNIGDINPSSATLRFGRSPNPDQFFNGIIDGVRIYNRALSDSEIMELYINPYGMFLEEGCPEILCTLNII